MRAHNNHYNNLIIFRHAFIAFNALILAITFSSFNDKFSTIYIMNTKSFYNCLLLVLHYCRFLDGCFLDDCFLNGFFLDGYFLDDCFLYGYD